MNKTQPHDAALPHWTALKLIGGASLFYCGVMALFAHAFYSVI